MPCLSTLNSNSYHGKRAREVALVTILSNQTAPPGQKILTVIISKSLHKIRTTK